jgi:hypothetical protein
MIAYPAFFSYCPLFFSAISIHIGFKSVIWLRHQFSLPKDLLKLNYSVPLHVHSSNEQTHSAGDGHVNMALVYMTGLKINFCLDLLVCKISVHWLTLFFQNNYTNLKKKLIKNWKGLQIYFLNIFCISFSFRCQSDLCKKFKL